MGMTVVEKILSLASGLSSAKAGDIVEPKIDLAMSHENAALVINPRKYEDIIKNINACWASVMLPTLE